MKLDHFIKILSVSLVAILFFGILFLFRRSQPVSSPDCKNCNVILITLTNLRYDHMSGNGYSRPTTTNLDALAKESLVFDNTFSHSSWTLPSGISIFTSQYPFQYGVMNRFDGSTLSKSTPSLIDILASNGYKTAGFTGGFDYDPRYGLTNRYGEYQDCNDGGMGYGKIGCSISDALNWIKNNRNSKFFVQVQGYDAHCPFSQKGGLTYDKDYKGTIDFSNCLWTFDKSKPIIKNGKKYYKVYSSKTGIKDEILLSEADVNHLVALYDESITESDALIGSFLNEVKAMGLEGNTIIVFTSEHGDMFGKYGIFMRGGPLRGTFYDDVLHIPLIMKIPNLKPARYNELVQHIDIAPTLLDFLALKSPPTFQGVSLIPVIVGNKEIHDYVFAGSEYHPGIDNVYFNDSTRVESIRSKDWKLIKETNISKSPNTVTYELFDLSKDAQEVNNLYGSNNVIFKNLEKQLDSWAQRVRASK